MTDKQIISNGYNSLARDFSSELDTPLTSQIIIDGVDVSGCEFRFRTYGCDCMSSNRETKVLTESSRCADNPNCYYKQLKRKEQECERLKEENKTEDLERHQNLLYELGQTILSLDKQLDQLKAEDEINKILYKNCPCRYQYNVFGVPDKDCCHKYHKYCKEVVNCEIKEGLKNGQETS